MIVVMRFWIRNLMCKLKYGITTRQYLWILQQENWWFFNRIRVLFFLQWSPSSWCSWMIHRIQLRRIQQMKESREYPQSWVILIRILLDLISYHTKQMKWAWIIQGNKRKNAIPRSTGLIIHWWEVSLSYCVCVDELSNRKVGIRDH